MMDHADGSSRLMARAFELARGVLGTTSPNPAVGAVIAQGSQIVGEGATRPPGEAHAEVVALTEAAERARGATLYVTLEPCAHYGRTPPCTEAIIAAGIDRVVVAVSDPDPQVSGRGLRQLRDAGIAVSIGDGAAEGARHYEAYASHRRSGRPFVTAKFAASLDGRIASTSGDSRWISGPQTLRWAHQHRPFTDAILVGVETIIVDNPQLTARPEHWRGPVPQPLRVVLDSRGRTPLDSRVLDGVATSPTLIATTAASDEAWRTQLQSRGVDVEILPSDAEALERGYGRVSLPSLLDLLGRERGIVSLLVEGGGEVLGSFFDQRLIDKVTAVIAPMIIGGAAQTAVRGRGAERMRDVLRLDRMSVERLGVDLLVTGYASHPEHELDIRIRPAGQTDCDAANELLAAQGVVGMPTCESLLAEARSGDAVIWLATTTSTRHSPLAAADAAEATEDVLGVGAVQLDGSERAEIRCLTVRSDAPSTVAERLRAACEASASGRDHQWLTLTLSNAPAVTEEQSKSAGYRYYRRNQQGAAVLIRRLGAFE